MIEVRDTDFALYEGDAVQLLRTFPRRFFDAIVTSPPYLDARADVQAVRPDEYGAWSTRWLEAALRVTSPTGSLMLNLGRVHRDGEERDYWLEVVARAHRVGWRWIDSLVWHKVNAGGGRKTSYLIDRHEHVFWLSPSLGPYQGFDEARVPYSPATLERYTRKWRGHGVAKGNDGQPQDGRTPNPLGAKPGSVFTSSVGAEKGIGHPTPMAPELAEHLVVLSCPPGGLVLDPFAGSGTTALACRRLGRRSVAFELDHGHAEECARRLSQQTLLPIVDRDTGDEAYPDAP